MLRRLLALLSTVVVAASLVACTGDEPERAATEEGGSVASTASPAPMTATRLCDAGVTGTVGTVAAADLTETSGLAASRSHPGALWAHNDSGADAEIFAVGEDGADLGRVPIGEATAFDWEDVALGSGTDGPDQLYLADIGDNAGARPGTGGPIRIHRIPEPDPEVAVTAAAVTFALAYPDGARDAETLLVDPVTGDLFIVSKQWDGAPSGLYRVPAQVTTASAAPPEALVLERLGDLPATAGTLVTGGDVSADGTMVALRTYPAVWLWDRDPAQTLAETLAAPPTCQIPVLEPQGEAVAFTADGRGFATVSEGESPPVLVRRLP